MKALTVVVSLLSAVGLARGWSLVTDSANWTSRTVHASVVFDNRMWLVGGSSPTWPDTLRGDVWYSTDGDSWTRATPFAPWGPRGSLAAVVYDSKMWVLGGWSSFPDAIHNDVWYSEDGTNWRLATGSADWSPRGTVALAEFDDKMWLTGGWSGDRMSDVWWSDDGVTWSLACEGQWPARSGHSLVVFDGKMWVLGGAGTQGVLNDVWWSTDGDSWHQATASAPWVPRWGHTSVVFDNKLWVIGGADAYFTVRYNDIWWSSNGEYWTQEGMAEWRPRAWHTSPVYDNRMWVIGGDSLQNELAIGQVWSEPGAGVQEASRARRTQDFTAASIVRGSLLLPQDMTDSGSGEPDHVPRPALLDATGRRVTGLKPGENDIRHVVPGVYFCRLTAGSASGIQGSEGPSVRKVIVTR